MYIKKNFKRKSCEQMRLCFSSRSQFARYSGHSHGFYTCKIFQTFFLLPLSEMRHLITEISAPAEGQLQERKASLADVVSCCEVHMMNTTPQIVTEGYLLCAFLAVETGDELSYR